MAQYFTPEYLSIDFNTLIVKLREELQNSAIFNDYNYEGSNISVLIELMSYQGELNTFFLNKLAKNIYLETTDIYENASRLARQVGYNAKGHRSAKSTITIDVTSGGTVSTGDVLYIPAWKQINSSLTYESEIIKYATTSAYTETVTSSGDHSFSIEVIQGVYTPITGYKGSDLIDNELLLPEYKFAHSEYENIKDVIEVYVNDEPWTRVDDFYEGISALGVDDDVFMFVYDKYERYKIVFSEARNTPTAEDGISLKALKSLGANGGAAATTIITPEDLFMRNLTTDAWIDNSVFSVSNSAASLGAEDPEIISTIKENAKSIQHAQKRNVSKEDYRSNLQERADIITANVWGEQDLYPSGGHVDEYNKINITVIPSQWESNTISVSASTWSPTPGVSGSISTPYDFSSSYQSSLELYLEPRKIITTYEVFQIPELVYFYFEIGLRLKRLYTFTDVQLDIYNKLNYWFRSDNKSFADEINFMDIEEYLMNTTETSPTDTFENIKGIRNLNIRDIDVNTTIYEPNNQVWNYPQYTTSSWSNENTLRSIKLGINQFPVLSLDTLSIINEESVT
jgi:hypothetical protein